MARASAAAVGGDREAVPDGRKAPTRNAAVRQGIESSVSFVLVFRTAGVCIRSFSSDPCESDAPGVARSRVWPGIRRRFVGHDAPWHEAIALHQLDQLIDRPPQPECLAGYRHLHFVQMPYIAGPSLAARKATDDPHAWRSISGWSHRTTTPRSNCIS